jgi:hypothetical protein
VRFKEEELVRRDGADTIAGAPKLGVAPARVAGVLASLGL